MRKWLVESTMRRVRLVTAAAVGCLLVLAGLYWPLPGDYLHKGQLDSWRLLDRNGEVLREISSSSAGVAKWVPLEQISPKAVASLVMAEDKRFYYHIGWDPLALLRSCWVNLRNRKILMGGSTITQQVVRLLEPEQPRTISAKIRETWQAMRLEANFTKSQILECYLNRVYFGNHTYGIAAASEYYFGKSCANLSPAEGALLAVIPRAPGSYGLATGFAEASQVQRQLLGRMHEAGLITATDYKLAIAENVDIVPLSERFAAPHFCDLLVERSGLTSLGQLRQVRTTIDGKLQTRIENLTRFHLAALAKNNVTEASVLVLDAATGQVLSWVGSSDYFARSSGQVDGVLSLRQPGSSLKPFLYELALEKGYTAASILPDLGYGIRNRNTYVPRNYDLREHGPVLLRNALACSLNLAAVNLLDDLSTASFLDRLHLLGFNSLQQSPQHYGTGLVLGNGEVTLWELTSAYRTLANSGRQSSNCLVTEVETQKGWQNCNYDLVRQANQKWVVEPVDMAAKQVLEAVPTAIITDILADSQARAAAFGSDSPLDFPFVCAAKTGTSKDYRDNWTVGYTPDYVVGVWVGNHDASAMHNVSGITGAGPLFHDVMMELCWTRPETDDLPRAASSFPMRPELERVSICAASGALPGKYCPQKRYELFTRSTCPTAECQVHKQYRFRRDNGRLAGPNEPDRDCYKRVLTVWPEKYHAWMAERDMIIPPQSALGSAKRSPLAEAATELRILYPDDGALYRLDPVLRRQYQKLTAKATIPKDSQQVKWYVDGQEQAKEDQPNLMSWQLRPGVHKIKITAAGDQSHTISITVVP